MVNDFWRCAHAAVTDYLQQHMAAVYHDQLNGKPLGVMNMPESIAKTSR